MKGQRGSLGHGLGRETEGEVEPGSGCRVTPCWSLTTAESK